ncbi:MAG: MarR family transcriptional regulator [Deltaproteobacteria bacterium]|nr:MarR family transcriptional regulator [Deltaproteobacteria bacterium]
MNKTEFLKAINTLKLYRRAELLDDEGRHLIDELYVDPLPDDHVLHTVLRPNTTFLFGRKGTGKSTIFQRAQESLDSDKNATWAYIDIKTLFESSTSEIIGAIPKDMERALSEDAVKKLSIFKNFVVELVKEIRKQISIRIESSLWSRIKSVISGSAVEVFEKLDEFIEDIERDSYINITGTIQTERKNEESEKKTGKISGSTSSKMGVIPAVEARFIAELISQLEKKKSENYSEVFIKVFNIRGLIARLREILSILNLKHIYIFIDDFSELRQCDMEEIVDTVLSPFNNWSEEFIKLKVAVYPGRLYLGNIDRSKVDEVYLDIYREYGRNDLSGMEEKAIEFTKRLLMKRFNHFCGDGIEKYMEVENEEFWKTLFDSCLGNPRILGYILFYAYETNIIYNKRIGILAIQSAARRYYEEKIDQYFKLNKFLHETFEERSSIFSLKELLEEIVKRSKSLRSYRESKMMSELPGRPPTSHFHVVTDYDPVLSTLELNFFLTKYYEMKDRDGRDVSVYALNYGLCQQQAISFGRPMKKREHRLYFVERIFDYSPIIASYIKVNQEIVCDSCGRRHDHEMLPAIQTFDMLCPGCKTGKCKIVNLSRKYERLIKEVSEENLLPATELGILKTLHDERRTMFAKEIAAELDCSYQLVGKRGRNLSERDLISREENEQGRRVFEIKDGAEAIYFMPDPNDNMDFGE